ncbi:hypothetical protein V5738_04775 [Salinisphaera sp. SPP-AMP-43]
MARLPGQAGHQFRQPLITFRRRSVGRGFAAIVVATVVMLAGPAALAQPASNNAQELAKALSNPVASLISVPIQQNFDFGFASDNDGWRSTTNIQPVVPISISEDWNLISRTILPVIYQDGVTRRHRDQFGLGDTVQSAFFSPKQVGPSGIIWGVGPAFLLPTATKHVLGSEKWGIGPTAVALKQSGPLTMGALANHIWSFAGDNDRRDVSSTFMQPFIAYTNKNATTFTVNSETTYDWKAKDWLVPFNFQVNQLLKVGQQPIQIGGGVRYYADSPRHGPDWGLRFNLIFLFPKS